MVKKKKLKAEKLFESGDVKGASDLLTNNENLFKSADQKVLRRKYILRQKLIRQMANFNLHMISISSTLLWVEKILDMTIK